MYRPSSPDITYKLHHAILSGNTIAFEKELANIARLPNKTDRALRLNALDDKGYTPLCDAAWTQCSTYVLYLLNAGANPNAQSCNMDTPLHMLLQGMCGNLSFAHRHFLVSEHRLRREDILYNPLLIVKKLFLCKADLTLENVYEKETFTFEAFLDKQIRDSRPPQPILISIKTELQKELDKREKQQKDAKEIESLFGDMKNAAKIK